MDVCFWLVALRILYAVCKRKSLADNRFDERHFELLYRHVVVFLLLYSITWVASLQYIIVIKFTDPEALNTNRLHNHHYCLSQRSLQRRRGVFMQMRLTL
jgi:hypothetical protein